MYIAAMTDGPGLAAPVSRTFAGAAYLLILDADKGQVVTTYPRGAMDDEALARKIVLHDCEAVLCGPIEQVPFVIIADEGCVTRYEAGGLRAGEALARMAAYKLPMITDFIGGTGCGSGKEENCDHRHENFDDAF